MLINAALTLTAFVSGSLEATTSLSNVEIPRDTSGRPIVTGETSILRVNDTFYYYVNDWGECAPIDCCPSLGGCASCCYVPPTFLQSRRAVSRAATPSARTAASGWEKGFAQ